MRGAVSPIAPVHAANMPRQSKAKPSDLIIPLQPERENTQAPERSPESRGSTMNLEGIDLSSIGGDVGSGLSSLPPLPQSPPTSPRLNRDPPKTFLSNFKNRISPEQERRHGHGQTRSAKDDEDQYNAPGNSSMSKIYHLRKNPGSTPELSLVGSAENVGREPIEVNDTQEDHARSEVSPHHSEDSTTSAKRRENKGFRNPLSRTKSLRRDSNSKSKPNGNPSFEQPPKTAPLNQDWPGVSEMSLLKAMSNNRRGKSAERAAGSESEEYMPHERAFSTREKSHNAFMSGSKHVMSKAKTGGGAFLNRLGKIGRSASGSNDKDVPDSEYVLKIITLPLIDQTRITRISKDLADCRDKTEYWMPSLPWRCIDFLNYNCEAEGLYRVPGSTPQVKHWQRRFDTELDVDLLDEEDLYDPNTVGSMLKSWLRDLPTEIMPKALQRQLAEDIEKEVPDFQRMGLPAPQILRDALSELSPFNYYLLFAITCHLSLLLSHKEKNKMDLNNLSICIGPCLDLDRWLFNYLVGDWRNCWQGCFTEKEYVESEKAHEKGVDYEASESHKHHIPITRDGVQVQKGDDRAVHSSGSNGSGNSKGPRDPSRSRTRRDESRTRRQRPNEAENAKPETYQPAGYSSYASSERIATPPDRKHVANLEIRRPSTAENREIISDIPGSPPTLILQHHGHSRSQSDLLIPIMNSSSTAIESSLQYRGHD